jgi:hypothetical protein
MPTFDSDLLPTSTGRKLGAQDARWDASLRNLDVSGEITGAFTALAIFSLKPKTVAWSATPNFDGLDRATGYKITLNGDTVPTLTNLPAGMLVAFVIQQDNVGNRAWTWPGIVRGGMAIGTGPGEASAQLFWNDGTTLWALTGGEIQ